ncbi:MAG: metallophosphoesterase [Arthrobacter sp.]|uniref:metallophosphoesterase n=1 Tax=unclassified Arthrobacter TaxID=235627 RepID=UPI002651E687|nr:metallophosphoesterase [Micrococcaceae bacterium]MDN5813708.1 metallophosphoesterase [Micrococcaceae bacterium]MDN5824590.1 metallophosphoesterase [Micrococcaceae bacterium]MDN5879138.1 metallophosphoesterase [Micrococcaceae bacterium]MDN5886806.1 metallophosphoesterase [Micrococcaceae bacterium]
MGASQDITQAVKRVVPVAGAAAGIGASLAGLAIGYGLLERNAFTIRHETVQLLPPGMPDLRVLHLSDIHLVPGQDAKKRWLRSLAGLAPDLVVNTGDNLSHRDAVPELLEALEPLMAFPGVFVPGSNCYYGPRLKNPLRYLTGGRDKPRNLAKFTLPWQQMHAGFGAAGWTNLTNRAISKPLNGVRLDFSGVDDPHLKLEQFAGWPRGSSTAGEAPHVRIALTHAPYQRVLDQFTDSGADIIFAGHTHGGQICVPGYGALVSNCDLPTWRARGLTEWEHRGKTVPLEVSAGIGTSRYAPVRIACPPEAVLLTLTARD